MIHYLLYLVPKETISKKRKKYFWAMIISLLLLCGFIVAFLMDMQNHQIIKLIVGLIGLIGFVISAGMVEKQKKRTVRNDFGEYNDELDQLRTILKNADFNHPINPSTNEKQNWYTKKKIKYLIEEFENLSSIKSTNNDPSFNALKYTLIPVISFASGAIADKAKLNTTVLIAISALILILSIWSFFQAGKIIFDEIYYNQSDAHIKRIHSLLKDLYIRDFDESATANSDSSSQTNTP